MNRIERLGQIGDRKRGSYEAYARREAYKVLISQFNPEQAIEGEANVNEQRYRNLISDVWRRTGEGFGAWYFKKYQKILRKDDRSDLEIFFESLTASYLANILTRKILQSQRTSRNIMSRLVAQYQGEGLNNDEILRKLESDWEMWSRVRANAIAQTEVVGASNFGIQEGSRFAIQRSSQSQLSNQLNKYWVDRDDGRVRIAHRHVSPVQIVDKFNVGGELLAFPGDPEGKPGNIINCRCIMVPFVQDLA